MKIIIIVDDYLPFSTLGHAKQMHALAVQFQKFGHEVVVLTPGGSQQKDLLHITPFHGVSVWRYRAPSIRAKSKVRRAIRETLLPLRAFRALRQIGSIKEFDMCVYWSPTIFHGVIASWFKRSDCFTYLILRDFFPQWAIEKGILNKHSLVTYFFHFFEYLNYMSAHMIGVQSPSNISIFKEMTKYRFNNVEVLYNWASLEPLKSTDEFGKQYIQNLQLSKKVILFYGGNIGHAQDMGNIVRLAENLKTTQNAHILLIGQGDEFEAVASYKSKYALHNLTLLSSVTQTQYESILQNVSIGLFSLAKEHTAHNIPGKLLGYVQAKIPILGSVNMGNDVIDLINNAGAGLVSVNGNDEKFYANAKKLISSAALRTEMGNNGHVLLHDTFSVVAASKQILKAKYQKTAS